MALSFSELRQKLKEQENKPKFNDSQDNISYPFWDIPENSSVSIRFLPDQDTSNDWFWRERLIIRMPFSGIKGENDKETTVQIPCMEMFGESCPVIQGTKHLWKEESTKELARLYYKKPSYIFQGFVLDNPLENDKLSPTTIRRFIINSSIFKLIKSGLMDPDIEESPIHYVEGRDFVLSRTKQGGYSSYHTSKYRMKVRSLSESELTSVKENGLYDLKQFLPAHPGKEGVQAIKEMFEASMDGEPFDNDRWGKYFKAYGNNSTGNTARPKNEDSKPVSKPIVKEAVSATVSDGDDFDIEAVLQQIKGRA